MTATGAPARAAHECEPLEGTVYSAGPRNAGRTADVRNAGHYPLTAVCACGEVIRCDHPGQSGWLATGRVAGQ